jgi:hypothetical protein
MEDDRVPEQVLKYRPTGRWCLGRLLDDLNVDTETNQPVARISLVVDDYKE